MCLIIVGEFIFLAVSINGCENDSKKCYYAYVLEIFSMCLSILSGSVHLLDAKETVSNVSGWLIRVITKLPNSEQSYKGKVKTHKYINRQNQSTTGKLWKP